MKVVRTVEEFRTELNQRRSLGTVGFVPTMGALHDGHISLVDYARKECATVAVSIFVNPTQFNDPNDLKNYPRTEEADAALLSQAGVDIVFIPSVEQIYPQEDRRQFDFGLLDKVMEGQMRPGHFNGVAQVVSRLFDIVEADRAYFGEKDFQQLAIIRELVRQLNLKIEIIGCPIVRAEDGLALSSRNMLLTAEHRAVAPLIYKTLKEGVELSKTEGMEKVRSYVTDKINSSELLEVEYFDVVNAESFESLDSFDCDCSKRGCIAVYAGKIRLIDNIKF